MNHIKHWSPPWIRWPLACRLSLQSCSCGHHQSWPHDANMPTAEALMHQSTIYVQSSMHCTNDTDKTKPHGLRKLQIPTDKMTRCKYSEPQNRLHHPPHPTHPTSKSSLSKLFKAMIFARLLRPRPRPRPRPRSGLAASALAAMTWLHTHAIMQNSPHIHIIYRYKNLKTNKTKDLSVAQWTNGRTEHYINCCGVVCNANTMYASTPTTVARSKLRLKIENEIIYQVSRPHLTLTTRNNITPTQAMLPESQSHWLPPPGFLLHRHRSDQPRFELQPQPQPRHLCPRAPSMSLAALDIIYNM